MIIINDNNGDDDNHFSKYKLLMVKIKKSVIIMGIIVPSVTIVKRILHKR